MNKMYIYLHMGLDDIPFSLHPLLWLHDIVGCVPRSVYIPLVQHSHFPPVWEGLGMVHSPLALGLASLYLDQDVLKNIYWNVFLCTFLWVWLDPEIWKENIIHIVCLYPILFKLLDTFYQLQQNDIIFIKHMPPVATIGSYRQTHQCLHFDPNIWASILINSSIRE